MEKMLNLDHGPVWGKEQRTLAALIQKWGNHASSALFDPTFVFFSTPSIDGLIGYRLRLNCAVVFGDPVCSPEEMPALVKAFQDFCIKQGHTMAFVIASEFFTNWALQHGYTYAIDMGVEFYLNPMIDPKMLTGAHAGELRNKWKQSQRKGIMVREYTGNDGALEQAMLAVTKQWLANRKGPQIHFYTGFDNLFSNRSFKRYFYAEHEGKVIGVIFLNRLDAFNGWIIHMSMIVPGAPATTSEFMVLSMLDILRIENCSYLSIGVNPCTRMTRLDGLGPIARWLAQNANSLNNRIFKLEKRLQYWKKFNPESKQVCMVTDKRGFLIHKGLGIMKAFNAAVW